MFARGEERKSGSMGSNVKRVCCLRRADLRARFEGMVVVLMCMEVNIWSWRRSVRRVVWEVERSRKRWLHIQFIDMVAIVEI